MMSSVSKMTLTDLAKANTYEEWLERAKALDDLESKSAWRDQDKGDDYDHRLIASRVRLLGRLKSQKDHDQLVFRLREELHGNLGNMANPALYHHARCGTKKLINRYLDEVCSALDLLCDSNVKTLPPIRKRRFFNRTARSFGRSALLLSGGASMGLFHVGVIEELMEQNLLPRVITGASAGSIVGGFLATHTDAELKQALLPDELKYRWVKLFGLGEIMKGDGLLDPKQLAKSIEHNIKDMTFIEAYEETGRILNISVSPADPNQFPRLLNYLSSPNVLIRKAAMASSAIPGLFPAVQLRARNYNGKSVPYMPQSRWIDGSVHEDIPKEKVNRLHNVNHYIVSQTNPHVVPFLNDELEKTGLLPFLQDVIVKGPMVQVEHVLDVAHRHFEIPGLGSLIKKAHAIVGQTYSGDITISPERLEINMSKLFANASTEDAGVLIQSGRRAVWPQIERIRNTTQISRTITACLQRLAKKYRYVKR
jgi:TAG lipase/steryl ester hydrolase/phospholipase A2/LPA acyltransferase